MDADDKSAEHRTTSSETDISTITENVVMDDSCLPTLHKACNDAFLLQRNTKQILSLEQQLLQIEQEELEETLKTIEADRQKINALQQEQTFTVRQIKDAMLKDVKRFESIVGSKQPDLLSYCSDLTTTRDCLQAIRSIRDCKYHIQLAETIIANKYATLLAERSTDSETGRGKITSSAIVVLGPLTGPSSHGTDVTSATASSSFTARKLRHLSLTGPSSTSSAGVSGGKTSTAARAQGVAKSSWKTANKDTPGIVRIEIRDRDGSRPGAKDQLLKPLAQTHSASSGPSSKSQKPTKT